MEQPEYTLKDGTKIRTHAHLARADGMMVHHAHLAARSANATGEIAGVVGGHGGDVYWVRHGSDECLAAYCFNEFELEAKKPDVACPYGMCGGNGIESTSPELSICPCLGQGSSGGS